MGKPLSGLGSLRGGRHPGACKSSGALGHVQVQYSKYKALPGLRYAYSLLLSNSVLSVLLENVFIRERATYEQLITSRGNV